MIWSKFRLDTGKNRPLYLQLADGVRELICRGELSPGEQIPSSRELQKQLGISPITVENALAMLVKENLLLRRPRRGTFVAAGVSDQQNCASSSRERSDYITAVFNNAGAGGDYWFQLLTCLEELLRPEGYGLRFRLFDEEEAIWRELRNSDGVIFCNCNPGRLTVRLHQAGIPLVLVGLPDTAGLDTANLDIVMHNDRERAKLSTAHLLSLGHRRIACLTGPAGSPYSLQQQQGFQDALAAYDLEPDPHLIQEAGSLELSSGVKCAYPLLCGPTRPTALYAGGDMLAIGVMQVAGKLGLQIPRDLSVIGCGNLISARVTQPVLTTTCSLPEETARLAVQKMLAQLHRVSDYHPSPTVVRVTEIEFGESTMICPTSNNV